jgi:hypothetical protein
MKELLLSDIHAGSSKESPIHPGILRQANDQAVARLQELVPRFNNAGFDLVFQMGDLVRETGDTEYDRKTYERTLDVLSGLKPPVISLLGNHELNTFGYDQLSDLYKRYNCGGEFFGAVEVGKYNLIWLDHQTDENGVQTLSDERLRWLDKTLSKSENNIVLSHYSVTPRDDRGNFYFENREQAMRYANSDQILEVLISNGVRYSINAHEHWISYRTHRGINFVGVPAFSENIAAQEYSENNPGIYTTIEERQKGLCIKSFSGDFCLLNIEI